MSKSPLLLLLACALSAFLPSARAESRDVINFRTCRGLSGPVCREVFDRMSFTDGCNRCRCEGSRRAYPVCSEYNFCFPEEPGDQQVCDKVRRRFRQRLTPRPPCLTAEKVCPLRPRAVFYSDCNRCQCRGRTWARCGRSPCIHNHLTDDEYQGLCASRMEEFLLYS